MVQPPKVNPDFTKEPVFDAKVTLPLPVWFDGAFPVSGLLPS
jgi:hypothetical protein